MEPWSILVAAVHSGESFWGLSLSHTHTHTHTQHRHHSAANYVSLLGAKPGDWGVFRFCLSAGARNRYIRSGELFELSQVLDGLAVFGVDFIGTCEQCVTGIAGYAK